MSEITIPSLRKQIAHLGRCMADVAFKMWIAQLNNDDNEYILLEVEYSRIEWTRDRLNSELRTLIALRSEQVQAVAEVERILEIGG